MRPTREPLFSVHTHSSGAIALYLEEQDAVKELVQDVVGAYEISDLDFLKASAAEHYKSEFYFENLESARENLGDNAPLVCNMSEDEALILAEDLVRAVKLARISREALKNFPHLRAVD
jgi:hypothetical protein